MRKPGPPIIQDTISYSQNSGLSLEQVVELKYPEFTRDVGLIERAAALYREKKTTSQSLDFDDLLLYLLRLLRNENHRKIIK